MLLHCKKKNIIKSIIIKSNIIKNIIIIIVLILRGFLKVIHIQKQCRRHQQSLLYRVSIRRKYYTERSSIAAPGFHKPRTLLPYLRHHLPIEVPHFKNCSLTSLARQTHQKWPLATTPNHAINGVPTTILDNDTFIATKERIKDLPQLYPLLSVQLHQWSNLK